MSKKHKSNRKPQPLAKKATALPLVIKAKNALPPVVKAKAALPPVVKAKTALPPVIRAGNGHSDERPVQKTVMPPPAPVAQVEPVPAPQERDAALPFWARMPFAVMDFWMSRTARGD